VSKKSEVFQQNKKEKVVLFSVSHTCVVQTFLSHALKYACIIFVGFNTYVINIIKDFMLKLATRKPFNYFLNHNTRLFS